VPIATTLLRLSNAMGDGPKVFASVRQLCKAFIPGPHQCMGAWRPHFPIELFQLCRAGSKFRHPNGPPRALVDLQALGNVCCLTQLIFVHPSGLIPCSNTTATNRFGAPDYRAIFSGQLGSASVNTTPSSDLCPRGWLTFSRSLSNEATKPKQLPQALM
jgi:hypothetical protein